MEQVPERVFRVTVRGRFVGLTDEVRRYLAAAQPDHDLFVSAYTPEGTLSYDARLDFFNLRYEVRAASESRAHDDALTEAELFLTTMRFAHGDLKATVVDMSAMWDDVDRRR